MNRIRPNSGRANRAIVFLWIMFAMQVATIANNFFQIDAIKRTISLDMTAHDMEMALIMTIIVNVVKFGVFIGASITFIQWFRRAYYNLHQRNEYLFVTEGWAAGAWFVPVLNLIYPAKIMWELMTETESTLIEQGRTDRKSSRRFLVVSWWTLWVAITLVTNLLALLTFTADDPFTGLKTSLVVTRWTSYVLTLYLPLTIIAMMMIREYNRMEVQILQSEGEPSAVKGSVDLLDTAL